MKKIFAVLFVTLLSSCSSTPKYYRPAQGDLAGVKRLAVVIHGDATFKVLDHRATDLGPGVLFGAVGIIANSVYTNSADSKLQNQLEEQAAQVSCLEFFKAELRKLLDESKKFEKIDFYEDVNTKRDSYDALLELSVEEWGIRLINERTENLVAYIIIEIKLVENNGKVLWRETGSEVSRSSYVFIKYQNQDGLLKEEVQKVVKDTAYRIASTLHYS